MISIPAWVATALLVFLLGQFGGAVMWAIHTDRRQALQDQTQTGIVATLAEIRSDLKSANLAVLSARVDRLELESKDHKQAHDRNRDRIGEMYDDLLREIDRAKDDAVERATRRPTPQHITHPGE